MTFVITLVFLYYFLYSASFSLFFYFIFLNTVSRVYNFSSRRMFININEKCNKNLSRRIYKSSLTIFRGLIWPSATQFEVSFFLSFFTYRKGFPPETLQFFRPIKDFDFVRVLHSNDIYIENRNWQKWLQKVQKGDKTKRQNRKKWIEKKCKRIFLPFVIGKIVS